MEDFHQIALPKLAQTFPRPSCRLGENSESSCQSHMESSRAPERGPYLKKNLVPPGKDEGLRDYKTTNIISRSF